MQIQNSSTIKELRTAAGLSISEGFPQQLANQIIPVIDINPKHLRRATILGTLLNRNTTGSNITVLSAQSEEVFVTGFNISNQQDATSDNVLIVLQATIDGVLKRFYSRQKVTATAGLINENIQLSHAIKIDLGSTIGFTLAFTVGASISDVVVYGYKVNPFENI